MRSLQQNERQWPLLPMHLLLEKSRQKVFGASGDVFRDPNLTKSIVGMTLSLTSDCLEHLCGRSLLKIASHEHLRPASQRTPHLFICWNLAPYCAILDHQSEDDQTPLTTNY